MRLRRLWLLLFCLSLPAAGCLSLPAAGFAQPRAERPSKRVARMVEQMSVEDQVGQLIMPWLLGNYLGFDADGLEQARRWVDSLHLGGIIISTGSPLDVAAKLNFLQRRSKIPLLIASDLEYGSAFRFQGGTPFPTNMGVAATGREADAYQMGRITGLEGRAVGVHLNFGPVADVNVNPANPIINVRSFGEDPARVARLVAAAVRGSQDAGMLATIKHFPGHGDTQTDSHVATPVVRADWSRLSSVELLPFRAGIEAGAAAVMTGHMALPLFVGDSTPATLSPAILTGVLRDSLGFNGLVVTDALDMAGVVVSYGGGEAAVRAFLAGSDLLLMPANPMVAYRAMLDAIRSGRVSAARLRASVIRLLTIKERLRLFHQRTVPLDSIGFVVGQRAFVDTARAIATRSMVLVHDEAGAVEKLRTGPATIAVVSYGEVAASGSSTFPAQLARRGHRVTGFRLVPTSGPASYDSAAALIRASPTAVFAVAIRVVSGSGAIGMPAPLADLIEASSRERPTILVSFGSPYLERQTPDVQALLLAWTLNPLTEEAAAAALSGAAITGTLPITLGPTRSIGAGVQLGPTERRGAPDRR